MTRKRFIKLLMSYGYSRNRAVQIAKNTNVPYQNNIAFYSSLNSLAKMAAECGKMIASVIKLLRSDG